MNNYHSSEEGSYDPMNKYVTCSFKNAPGHGKLRVMIADDFQCLLQAFAMILSSDFEIVGLAEDGRHLVEQAIICHPDIIVSDISMPLLTGPQAQHELIARGFDIPFVFVSAETELVQGATSSLVDKLDVFDELKPAILSTVAGQVYISNSASRKRPRKSGAA